MYSFNYMPFPKYKVYMVYSMSAWLAVFNAFASVLLCFLYTLQLPTLTPQNIMIPAARMCNALSACLHALCAYVQYKQNRDLLMKILLSSSASGQNHEVI